MPLKQDYKASETRDMKDKKKEIFLHTLRYSIDMLTYLEIKLILKHQYIGRLLSFVKTKEIDNLRPI